MELVMNVTIRGGKEIPSLDELKSILIKQFPMYKIRLFGKQVIWVTKSYYVGAKIGVSFSKMEWFNMGSCLNYMWTFLSIHWKFWT